LLSLPSQLAKPELQDVTVQAPVEHDEDALDKLHGIPQPLQFVFVRVEVSQPLVLLPSQLPQPVPHTGAQAPPEHEVVPQAFVHVVPQLPQLPRSLDKLRQTPLQQALLRHSPLPRQPTPSSFLHWPLDSWQPNPVAQSPFELQEVLQRPVAAVQR
jgi:hypothetical protein